MENCLECVNNCLHIFTSCVPKDTTTSNNTTNNYQLVKQRKMNDYFTLMLPTSPKVDDEIRIKAKLKENPKQFIINLCVESALTSNDDEDPMMIAFQFETTFNAHESNISQVFMRYKKGKDDWGADEVKENIWIADDVDEIDIMLRFTKHKIEFYSGGSFGYNFNHQYEISRIDRLQVGGDLEYIEEVALRYKKL